MTKYKFKIRARGGMIVDNLTIAGRDQADAERKLSQMYHGCQILESLALEDAPGSDSGDMDDILAHISRQDHAGREH
jgi:hypothetical protein